MERHRQLRSRRPCRLGADAKDGIRPGSGRHIRQRGSDLREPDHPMGRSDRDWPFDRQPHRSRGLVVVAGPEELLQRHDRPVQSHRSQRGEHHRGADQSGHLPLPRDEPDSTPGPLDGTRHRNRQHDAQCDDQRPGSRHDAHHDGEIRRSPRRQSLYPGRRRRADPADACRSRHRDRGLLHRDQRQRSGDPRCGHRHHGRHHIARHDGRFRSTRRERRRSVPDHFAALSWLAHLRLQRQSLRCDLADHSDRCRSRSAHGGGDSGSRIPDQNRRRQQRPGSDRCADRGE